MRVAVVGAGISGLSTAAYLGKAGLEVHVFEKNGGPGGRAGQLQTGNGYLFDMGPSWYWMPEIFDRFFADFGYDVQNLYTLKLLDPSFEIVFRNGYSLKVPSEINDLVDVFEKIEPGSGGKLRRFLRGEKGKYDTILDNLDKIPGLSFFELVKPDFGLLALRSKLFLSHRRHIRRFFSDQRLQLLMEFPVLFLGQPARKVPALYSFMSYAAIMKGTWYPYGGFGKVVEALMKVAEDNGAHFYFNSPVEEIILSGKKVNGINVSGNLISFDAVVCAADYHFAEQYLLPEWARNYDERYWQKKKFAPSCLIFFIGLSKKIGRVEHHTLFFY